MPKETCLCIDLRTAAQQLTQIYDEAMKSSGITVTQFSQLHLIQTLDGPTLKELSTASQLERSTLGRNLRVLEKLGFVSMRVGDDARTRTIHLTTRGRNAFKRAVPLWRGVQQELTGRLGIGGRDELNAMMESLTAPLAVAAP